MKNDNPEFGRCLKCNRRLKTEEAKKRGYGDCCWRKYKRELKQKHSYLFDVKSK